jgi:hypothetical protein
MVKIISFKTLALMLLVTFIAVTSFAQNPPPNPPPDPSSFGGSNQPVGGGAPLGSGLVILVALGLGYGFKKHNLNKVKPMI